MLHTRNQVRSAKSFTQPANLGLLCGMFKRFLQIIVDVIMSLLTACACAESDCFVEVGGKRIESRFLLQFLNYFKLGGIDSPVNVE